VALIDLSQPGSDLVPPSALCAASHIADRPAVAIDVARPDLRLLQIAEAAQFLLAALLKGLV
jgi:hypothetical protein